MKFIHVDVDNVWVYEKEFNCNLHVKKDTVYTQSLPLFLKLLKKYNAHATFMIIGRDLNLPACQEFCKLAILQGHEIANHTWSHPITFGKLNAIEKKEEIEKSHKMIKKVCNIEPIGFRGAGYYMDQDILKVLSNLNYYYDTSILPGLSVILLSAYAKIKGKNNRNKTFGKGEYFISSTQPHMLNKDIMEFPISVLPIVRLPIHSTFAFTLGSVYRNLILSDLKKRSYATYLFHAIDFLEFDRIQNSQLPTLNLNLSQKINYTENILKALRYGNKKILTTKEYLSQQEIILQPSTTNLYS